MSTYKAIKKVHIGSLAITIYFLDLILVIVTIVFTLLGAPIFTMGADTGAVGLAVLQAIVVYPIVAAIGAAMAGFFYNLIASQLGGIKIELE